MPVVNSLTAWLLVVTGIVGIVVGLWKLLPERRWYSFWCFTRLLRFNLTLRIGGAWREGRKVKYEVQLIDLGTTTPKYPIYLKTWEPSKRWFLVFNSYLVHTWWNKVGGETNDAKHPRINIHLLRETKTKTRVGFAVIREGYQEAGDPEYLRYKFKYGIITISKGKIPIP